MRFFRTPFVLPLIYPSLVWRIEDTGRKALFLTFDDGPIPGPTEFVLQTLKSFQIRATFFCIGDNVRRNPDIYKRIIDEGHVVGNHTFHHLNGWKTKCSDYIGNISKCSEVMAPQTTRLFRPPFGRITRKQISQLPDHKIIMWDVLTFDYDRSVTPAEVLKGALSAVRPGSIIVFHDSIKAEPNMSYALPRFVEKCLNDGYTFQTIP